MSDDYVYESMYNLVNRCTTNDRFIPISFLYSTGAAKMYDDDNFNL